MKKILLIALPLLVMGFISQAQITFTTAADTAYYNLPNDSVEQKGTFTVTSAYNTPVDIRWRVLGYNVPDENTWVSNGVCDWVTCIAFKNAGSWTTSTFPANDTKSVFVGMARYTAAPEGCSQIQVEIEEVGGPASAIVTIVHSSGADKTACGTFYPTSAKDLSKADLVAVYPNPTNNVINLNVTSKDIKSIELSNLVGKQISKINISNSGSSIHRMSMQSLPRGMYILQFKNDSGKVLGVSRITKN